jgi:molybdate transport system substrate-binding protein
MSRSTTCVLALLAGSALVLWGCSDDGTATGGTREDAPATTGAAGALEGTITVSAATSLTDAFTRIGDDFTADNPDAEVTFNFDSSSTLSAQILEGAPADAYAPADESNMAELTAEDLVAGAPAVFARNELVIITKPGNPEGITELADLADVGVVSLCGEDVPCGRYAAEALEAAGVEIPESDVTRGQNVGATLTAVAEGDAVAGIVYVTDALGAGDAVGTVPIPAEANVVAVYPIGVLAASEEADVAEAFMAHVLGADGQAVLEELGFLPPG